MAKNKKISNSPPKNIGIIMDGNGRWALQNSFKISKGHSKGVETVKEIVKESINQNVESLTLFAFSNENWLRPKIEVNSIKNLILKSIDDQLPELIEQKVKLNFFGNLEKFGKRITNKINYAQDNTFFTKPNLNLNIALSYGGRQDILDTFKAIVKDVKKGKVELDKISEDLFFKYSYTPIENIDLIIRTGGENRISNFLLYQTAYSEIFFTKKFWPDFSKNDLKRYINKFKKIDRRFGKRS